MRFGGRRTSSNVEGRGGGGFGRGGGGAPLLFGLVFSRFGFGGLALLVLAMVLLGDPLGIAGGGGRQTVAPAQRAASGAAEQCAEPGKRFLCQVLASTEDRWGAIFAEAGARYRPPTLVFYPGQVRTGCGAGEAAMGPFYCPADRSIYLDTSFFEALARQHGAPGDFAQAYVVAHEVGHHVQTLTGAAGAIRSAQAAVGAGEANALQVRMELQADCYAGVWAARERGAMEPGDLREGMTAAAAIGDDTLQRAGRGYVVPESFTHGTSEQRQQALMRGFGGGGDPAACERYTAGI